MLQYKKYIAAKDLVLHQIYNTYDTSLYFTLLQDSFGE